MDIFQFAMQMEVDGEKYYRNLAKKAPHKGIANILNMLADDEMKHYNVFRELKSKTPEMLATQVLANAKNVFQKMKDESPDIKFDISDIELYKKAQEVEKESQDFYLEKSKEIKQQPQREMFLRIAEEEERHYFLLDHLIDFLSKPYTWLENAEFFHLDEY
ncbi:MAG: hypothetical protein A2161_20505 [Candidatus Schekmanbacteria bacterium RBG_13_48_7]|uniref:Rubrerythrin diiron-binding domain-containing protein n=1 Tax=Candidatus Schekmanbacteria bacterium RBG_13_48_7 TaxID=1817878 RepID=A0A1F7RM65_9BACT|nr:MAG: hypothetical protein A2161_20505 [Candidatus Schekmanbacteria bacterium RBG_13_48_7]